MHFTKIESDDSDSLNPGQAALLERFFYPARTRGLEHDEDQLAIVLSDMNRLAEAVLLRSAACTVTHPELARLVRNGFLNASAEGLRGGRLLVLPAGVGSFTASLGEEIGEKCNLVAASLKLEGAIGVPYGVTRDFFRRLNAACGLPPHTIRLPRCAEICAAETDKILTPTDASEWFGDKAPDGRPVFRRDGALWLSATCNGQPTRTSIRPILDLTDIR